MTEFLRDHPLEEEDIENDDYIDFELKMKLKSEEINLQVISWLSE
jgi:hypothetical protein